jgi:hypothetical protein
MTDNNELERLEEEAAKIYGEMSPEHITALLKLLEATKNKGN